MGDLRTVSLENIRPNKAALRQVNFESEAFQGLVDSIKNQGFLSTITVREKIDPDTSESYFEVVDGLHRFSAAQVAGLSDIQVDIVSMKDNEVLEGQIMLNIHKIETKPVEYSKALRSLLGFNPTMTEAELANRLGKSTTWIQKRLGLNKITNPEIQSLIDSGKIKLANAYTLAKLPPEEQADFVDRAMELTPDEFIPSVNKRVKELNEARRKGQDSAPAEFTPVPFLQKLTAIKDAHESGGVGQELITRTGANDPQSVFQLALSWVLHLDPVSVDVQRTTWTDRRTAREEAKKRKSVVAAEKKAENARVKAEEAAKAAAEANAAI